MGTLTALLPSEGSPNSCHGPDLCTRLRSPADGMRIVPAGLRSIAPESEWMQGSIVAGMQGISGDFYPYHGLNVQKSYGDPAHVDISEGGT